MWTSVSLSTSCQHSVDAARVESSCSGRRERDACLCVAGMYVCCPRRAGVRMPDRAFCYALGRRWASLVCRRECSIAVEAERVSVRAPGGRDAGFIYLRESNICACASPRRHASTPGHDPTATRTHIKQATRSNQPSCNLSAPRDRLRERQSATTNYKTQATLPVAHELSHA